MPGLRIPQTRAHIGLIQETSCLALSCLKFLYAMSGSHLLEICQKSVWRRQTAPARKIRDLNYETFWAASRHAKAASNDNSPSNPTSGNELAVLGRELVAASCGI